VLSCYSALALTTILLLRHGTAHGRGLAGWRSVRRGRAGTPVKGVVRWDGLGRRERWKRGSRTAAAPHGLEPWRLDLAYPGTGRNGSGQARNKRIWILISRDVVLGGETDSQAALPRKVVRRVVLPGAESRSELAKRGACNGQGCGCDDEEQHNDFPGHSRALLGRQMPVVELIIPIIVIRCQFLLISSQSYKVSQLKLKVKVVRLFPAMA
jgi:hypothetical protein